MTQNWYNTNNQSQAKAYNNSSGQWPTPQKPNTLPNNTSQSQQLYNNSTGATFQNPAPKWPQQNQINQSSTSQAYAYPYNYTNSQQTNTTANWNNQYNQQQYPQYYNTNYAANSNQYYANTPGQTNQYYNQYNQYNSANVNKLPAANTYTKPLPPPPSVPPPPSPVADTSHTATATATITPLQTATNILDTTKELNITQLSHIVNDKYFNDSESDSQELCVETSSCYSEGNDREGDIDTNTNVTTNTNDMSKEEMEEYIKKHNKVKKKKKKRRKKKSFKVRLKKVSTPLHLVGDATEEWDNYEKYEKHLQAKKEQKKEQEKKKKKEPEKKKKKKKVIEENLKKKKAKLETAKYVKYNYKDEADSSGSDDGQKKKKKKKKGAKIKKNASRKKVETNLSTTKSGNEAFKIRPSRRYRIDDGRIGICKFKGKTLFGKANEDWLGIFVEYGDGAHNGTVKGKKYFRCAQGKGIMLRPERIIEDLGVPDGKGLTSKMIKGSKQTRQSLEDAAFARDEDKKKNAGKKKKKNNADIYDEWKPPMSRAEKAEKKRLQMYD